MKKRFHKIFAVLAVVLLALTFLSKSFYNYRLPVVKAALPRQGRLIFTVEGTSEFVYAHTESVYADVDGKIREILVDVGDEGPIVINGVQHIIHPPSHLAGWNI